MLCASLLITPGALSPFHVLFFFLMIRRPPRSTLFPYRRSSDNELLVEEGSLYPALQRLELNGWIDGVWGVTSNNRRARIYEITAAGRKQLTVETQKYAKRTLA